MATLSYMLASQDKVLKNFHRDEKKYRGTFDGYGCGTSSVEYDTTVENHNTVILKLCCCNYYFATHHWNIRCNLILIFFESNGGVFSILQNMMCRSEELHLNCIQIFEKFLFFSLSSSNEFRYTKQHLIGTDLATLIFSSENKIRNTFSPTSIPQWKRTLGFLTDS